MHKGMKGGKVHWVSRSFKGIARICKDHALKTKECVAIVGADKKFQLPLYSGYSSNDLPELIKKAFESVPKHRLD